MSTRSKDGIIRTCTCCNKYELRAIKFVVQRKSILDPIHPGLSIKRDLEIPEDLIVHIKDGEGQRPIFDRDDIRVNEEREITLTDSKQSCLKENEDNGQNQYYSKSSEAGNNSFDRENLQEDSIPSHRSKKRYILLKRRSSYCESNREYERYKKRSKHYSRSPSPFCGKENLRDSSSSNRSGNRRSHSRELENSILSIVENSFRSSCKNSKQSCSKENEDNGQNQYYPESSEASNNSFDRENLQEDSIPSHRSKKRYIILKRRSSYCESNRENERYKKRSKHYSRSPTPFCGKENLRNSSSSNRSGNRSHSRELENSILSIVENSFRSSCKNSKQSCSKENEDNGQNQYYPESSEAGNNSFDRENLQEDSIPSHKSKKRYIILKRRSSYCESNRENERYKKRSKHYSRSPTPFCGKENLRNSSSSNRSGNRRSHSRELENSILSIVENSFRSSCKLPYKSENVHKSLKRKFPYHESSREYERNEKRSRRYNRSLSPFHKPSKRYNRSLSSSYKDRSGNRSPSLHKRSHRVDRYSTRSPSYHKRGQY